MSCLSGISLNIVKPVGNKPLEDLSADLVQKMRDDSNTPEPISVLSGTLFSQLRKVMNQDRFHEVLRVIQGLAMEGGNDGARLLAAFLDVNTPGARLLPQVKEFHSSRRRRLRIIENSTKTGNYEKAWLRRLGLLVVRSERLLTERKQIVHLDESKPGLEAPWPILRTCLHALLSDVAREKALHKEHRDLLVGLLKLETDSRQDRVSNLAGSVNPFNIPQVARLLPILNTIDGDIRDLRQLMAWIEEGQDKVVFNKRLSRGLEVMDGNDFARLLRADDHHTDISALLQLLRSQNDNPLPLAELAAGMVRLMALSQGLQEAGLSQEKIDPLMAATLVHAHYVGKEVWIPLEAGISTDVQKILQDILPDSAMLWWPLSGIRVVGSQLCVPLTGGDELTLFLLGSLPSFSDVEKLRTKCLVEDAEAATDDSGVEQDNTLEEMQQASPDDSKTAVSHLVMQNIQSVSVLLGFLRNPKITAIPGLVAKVAGRTRNPSIIETIATDRTLYSGFANRDVPLACLTSPCNVSVKTLVKFIHVKYISKVDLRRMVKDKTGMRREVLGEIEKYLSSLD